MYFQPTTVELRSSYNHDNSLDRNDRHSLGQNRKSMTSSSSVTNIQKSQSMESNKHHSLGNNQSSSNVAAGGYTHVYTSKGNSSSGESTQATSSSSSSYLKESNKNGKRLSQPNNPCLNNLLFPLLSEVFFFCLILINFH